jgi:hypothetical protein
MYVCMHACIHVCMYVCMYACIYVCINYLSECRFQRQSALPSAPSRTAKVMVRISCLLVCFVGQYLQSFQSYQMFLLHITPMKSCNIKKGVFYVTIFARHQLGDEFKICLWYFIKSSIGNHNISQWSVQHITWYVNRSTSHLSMASSHGQYQHWDHLETTRIERALWNMSDIF